AAAAHALAAAQFYLRGTAVGAQQLQQRQVGGDADRGGAAVDGHGDGVTRGHAHADRLRAASAAAPRSARASCTPAISRRYAMPAWELGITSASAAMAAATASLLAS